MEKYSEGKTGKKDGSLLLPKLVLAPKADLK